MAHRFVFAKKYIKNFAFRVMDDDVFGLSAQLAYYFLLSLFPFLIFAFALLSYIGIDSEKVLNMVEAYAPSSAFDTIQENLQSVFDDQHSGLLSFGILATIWSASNAINSTMRGLNRAYDVEENRNFFHARGIAILLTFAMIIVIVVALALPVFGELIGVFIVQHLGLAESNFLPAFNVLRWLISFLIIIVVFSCLYYFGPNKRLYLKDVMFGAVIAAVGWQVASLGFSYYVGSFGNYSATYGSLGGIIVLMIWFYLTGFIIIIGGEINAVNHYFR